MSRKLYRSGTGRICICYCTHISTRVILRFKRLDQSLGEDNFQIKLAKQSRPYALHGHTRVHIIIAMCMCDYVSKTFGITRERFECKFSYNPPVNKTKIRTWQRFLIRSLAYMRGVCAPQEVAGKNTKINYDVVSEV
ncbi:hypothetical protein QTP88_014766 [Uroleucon formosanum]